MLRCCLRPVRSCWTDSPSCYCSGSSFLGGSSCFHPQQQQQVSSLSCGGAEEAVVVVGFASGGTDSCFVSLASKVRPPDASVWRGDLNLPLLTFWPPFCFPMFDLLFHISKLAKLAHTCWDQRTRGGLRTPSPSSRHATPGFPVTSLEFEGQLRLAFICLTTSSHKSTTATSVTMIICSSSSSARALAKPQGKLL